jgi:DNA-binding transcriptional LysR family regulator
VSVRTAGRIVVTEFGPVIGACLGGAGIARVKAIGVQELLANGRLIDLLPDWPASRFLSTHFIPRAFIDFVVERVGLERN